MRKACPDGRSGQCEMEQWPKVQKNGPGKAQAGTTCCVRRSNQRMAKPGLPGGKAGSGGSPRRMNSGGQKVKQRRFNRNSSQVNWRIGVRIIIDPRGQFCQEWMPGNTNYSAVSRSSWMGLPAEAKPLAFINKGEARASPKSLSHAALTAQTPPSARSLPA